MNVDTDFNFIDTIKIKYRYVIISVLNKIIEEKKQ